MIFAFGACTALVLSGCYFGNQTIDIPGEKTLEEVAEEIRQSSCVITFRDARSVEADSAQLLGDSITVWTGKRETSLALPLRSVSKISTRDVGDGVIPGILTGLAGGVAVGLIVGLSGGAEDLWVSGTTAEEKTWTLAAGLGFLGGLTGGLIGAATGGHTDYVLQQDSTYNVQPPAARRTIIVSRLEAQDESTVTIIWGDQLLRLPRADIVLKEVREGMSISMPSYLLERPR
jgi:hypothetical protein